MRRRLLTLLGALALVLVAGTSPASAHGDEGELTLTKVEQTGPTTVSIEVGIVFEGDGHQAEGAQVTATLSGPDFATVGPVDLTRSGDTTSPYQAAVEVPVAGEWSVAVTSTDPAGEVSGSLTVAADYNAAAEDSGVSPALVIGAGLVLAALVIGGAVLVARKRSTGN